MKTVLTCGLAALLCLAGASCHKQTSAGVSVPEAFEPLVGSDAQALLSVDVAKLKASKLYQAHASELPMAEAGMLQEHLGIPRQTDVSKVLAVIAGQGSLLLAEGAFGRAQVEERLTADGAKRISYKSFTLFEKGRGAVALPKDGLLAAGEKDGVQKALDGGGSVPQELTARMALVRANSQVWGVSRGGMPKLPIDANLESNLLNITAYISSTAFGVTLDSGIHANADILCVSGEGAQHVNDALRGMVGFARLATRDNELDLLRLWDAVSIRREGETIRISADLPEDLSEKVIARLPALRRRAGSLLNK